MMLQSIESISSNVSFLLEEHSKDTWVLIGLSTDTQGTRVLELLGHSRDTWALLHSRHWGTKALGHSGTRGTLFSRLPTDLVLAIFDK